MQKSIREFCHLADQFRQLSTVSRKGHNRTVPNGELICLNGGEQGVVGIQILCESGGAARVILAVCLHPVAITVQQFLTSSSRFNISPPFFRELFSKFIL
jgi:hypothetical protein